MRMIAKTSARAASGVQTACANRVAEMGCRGPRRLPLFLLGSAVAGLCFPGAALAQPAAVAGASAPPAALGEIVVTARRREENLQNTPVAITAISSETLEKRNIVNLAQLSRAAPNLTIYQTSGSLGAAGLFMRGIGYADTIPGQDSPIGIYVDGVIAGRNGIFMMPLVEPERVEVLRGPQGTLFGRNTTGGAVLITTHQPTDEFSGMAKASYGTFNDTMVQARIDTGLLGQSGVKLSAAYQHQRSDGSFDAIGLPRDLDPGAQDGDAYWLKAVGTWDKLSATFSADYNEVLGTHTPLQVIEANGAVRNFLALSSSLYGSAPIVITREPLFTLANAFAGQQKMWNQGIQLTLNYEVNEHLSLKSISALRAYERHDPAAYGPPDIRGNVGTVAAPLITTFNGMYSFVDRGQGSRQRSQEFQALGSAGDFEYVGGLYYFDENAWDSGRFRLPIVTGTGATAIDSITNRAYTVYSKSLAAFGQADWRPAFLDKRLDLTGGLRWTKDTRSFAQRVPLVRSADLHTNNTSFLVSASYRWTPSALTYVRYSTGYRAGGFNARATAGLDPVFLPETLKSLEGGFKLDLLSNRVRLNGAVFLNRYNDLQSGVNIPPSSSGAGGNIAINANARYTGWELEFEAVPVEGLTLAASVGHVDPEYLKYPTALATGGLVSPGCVPIVTNGRLTAQDCAAIASFVYIPKTTADLSLSYAVPVSYGEWSAFLAYSYKSRIESDVFNLPSSPYQNILAQKGYGLLSGRIALSHIQIHGDTRAQIALFGDNLTNEIYNVQGVDFGSFATATWGERRTVGVEVRADF
jgi:iron complex outermembrane receptor protein